MYKYSLQLMEFIGQDEYAFIIILFVTSNTVL